MMMLIKQLIKSLPGYASLRKNLNNQYERDAFVAKELQLIPAGHLILDAGCGSQRYRQYCSHLNYSAQDFGQYTTDQKLTIGAQSEVDQVAYKYGDLDYIGDIWDIRESDGAFDAIMCTEVFEHIPFPVETLNEFSRLLRSGGRLILTAPSNCLRHMDPYFFYSGFSDRWFEFFLNKFGFKVVSITPVGNYYSWLAVEMMRTATSHSIFSAILLAPAFLYYYNKKPTDQAINTLCMGYHVVAEKI